MRIKKSPITFAHSDDFEHIIIITNTEENKNLVILIKNQSTNIDDKNMHLKVK